MPRSWYGFDEAKIARFLKEGRGVGAGPNYTPWLTVQDVPSRGRSHRFEGRVTGRIHQLLSDLEYRALLIYDWSDAVSDIREQFPLDRDDTRLALARRAAPVSLYASTAGLRGTEAHDPADRGAGDDDGCRDRRGGGAMALRPRGGRPALPAGRRYRHRGDAGGRDRRHRLEGADEAVRHEWHRSPTL